MPDKEYSVQIINSIFYYSILFRNLYVISLLKKGG